MTNTLCKQVQLPMCNTKFRMKIIGWWSHTQHGYALFKTKSYSNISAKSIKVFIELSGNFMWMSQDDPTKNGQITHNSGQEQSGTVHQVQQGS